MSRLDAPVTALSGVGPAIAEKLERLGVERVADLLFQLPIRYEDRTRITPVGAAVAGTRCVIHAEILLAEVVFRGRRSLLVRVGDGTGQLTLRFFHFSNAQKNVLQRGRWITCYGEYRHGPAGPEMVHPEFRVVPEDATPDLSDRLTPVYPTTEGIHQARMRTLVGKALAQLDREPLTELLPPGTRVAGGQTTLAEAIRFLHAPPPDVSLDALADGTHPCQRRLALEELVAHHVSLRQLRVQVRDTQAPALVGDRSLLEAFISGLPFEPTDAQQRVLDEILDDTADAEPMMRLVQGDVGAGKTVVAAGAALAAIGAGHQCALMAPTELLAEQHFRSFKAWFDPLGVEVAWLTGNQRAAERRESLAAVADGSARMVVGTHALFQEQVQFAALGLVIIDEQHRFGVHQRLSLRDKGAAGSVPHQLVMTATPIPRTLAMTAYADLDTSIIDALPPGRTPVTTVVVPEQRRDEVVQRVAAACAEGRQAYWVCPLVEDSDVLDYQAAETTAAMLREQLSGNAIGLVHGRMKPRDKERAMAAFSHGDSDVLVATTVIEVGVDVPNASLMIIENAERMGLAQLHQLRGRVGRGSAASSCVLLYKAPLSRMAKERLAVLRESTDGFVIADKDLELRGPGEVLGTRQAGAMNLRIADLARDADLLPTVHATARTLLDGDESTVTRRIDALVARWIGSASRYGNV
ncbi:MAG: ATP-dependent DNA helicase RecG [Pseudomonadota bacterium]